MTLTAVAQLLLRALEEHAVVVGGICGALYGVERFTRDVDLATDLDAEAVVARLEATGIAAAVVTSTDPLDLPWVVNGVADGVPFQILPAARIGVSVAEASLLAGLRVPSVEAFMRSKCIAGGQQDLHDVAVLCLLDPGLLEVARRIAAGEDSSAGLESWLADRRLRLRYGLPMAPNSS